jgi:hypothetical protein
VDLVGGWLSKAYANGFNDIEWLRENPDLANYRQARSREFAIMTTAEISLQTEFGFFNDDIVLSNDSPFSLTNLHVYITIRKDSREWHPEMECAYVAVGGTCIAENIVSIPNNSYDEAFATFDCDQCE